MTKLCEDSASRKVLLLHEGHAHLERPQRASLCLPAPATRARSATKFSARRKHRLAVGHAAGSRPRLRPHPCGLGARDHAASGSSHAALRPKLTDNITPKMAGLPCKLDGKDFIGHDALREARRAGGQRVGLKGVGRGIVREHYDLYSAPDGEKIGWTSSGTFAPYLGAVSRWAMFRSKTRKSASMSTPMCGRKVEMEIVPPRSTSAEPRFCNFFPLILFDYNKYKCLFCLFRIFSVLRFSRGWRILPAE